MKLKTGFNILTVTIAMNVMVACSSTTPTETRQWQPTPVTDFKTVAGKWEGLLIRNPRERQDDWLTLIISDTGTVEFVSYRTIGAFSGKGTSVLTDGKLTAKSDKGGQMTLQLYVDPASNDRMLKVDARDSGGFTYNAELKRTGEAGSAK